jgi:pilus assembly protein TadC
MYQAFSKIIPFYSKKMEEFAIYLDVKMEPRKFAGFIIFISFCLGIVSMVLGFMFGLKWYFDICLLFAIPIISLLSAYLIFMLKADARSKQVEEVLPDALQLMATNLRAGLTTEKALLVSAREEFGVLTTELRRVGREVATGTDIREALLNLSRRIKSQTLTRTINLIVFGISSGGELASLLEESAAGLRQQLITKRQVHATILMYTVFIFIAVGVISPLLFGLSSTLVELIVNTLSTVEMPDTNVMNLPFTFSKTPIEPSFIILFSIIALTISSIMSSLVLGLINSGEEKDGVKYIPMLLVLSIITFFIVRILIKKLLTIFIT